MTSLFKKIKRSEHNKAGVLNDVKKAVDEKLQQLAIYLSEKTKHIPSRRLAALLFVVCIVCSIMLTLNMFHSFKNKNVIKFQSISTPSIQQPHSPLDNDVVPLRIKSFHHYMDSLKKHDFQHYDSIVKRRPGLMDSIATIEQFLNK